MIFSTSFLQSRNKKSLLVSCANEMARYAHGMLLFETFVIFLRYFFVTFFSLHRLRMPPDTYRSIFVLIFFARSEAMSMHQSSQHTF